VAGVNAVSAGNWRIEQSKDRITDAAISSAVLMTRTVSHSTIAFPPPAQMQLGCFKGQPVVIFAFQFKVGSTRNAELGYRFDERPGHQPQAASLTTTSKSSLRSRLRLPRLSTNWRQRNPFTC